MVTNKVRASLSVLSDEQRQATIADTLRRLFQPGQRFEVRAIEHVPDGTRKGKVCSGVFDNADAAAGFALAAEQEGYNCYFGLNPRRTKPTNELRPGKASKDEDVLQRRWLLVDCDPIRPADCPSTDEEKRAARAVLRSVVAWLCSEKGWPLPLLGDSGNGWHALFRVDLPADDGGLVERVLAALAARFDTPAAKVDTRVFDPPRICRAYGTLNRKGEESPERPYRPSRLYDGGGTKAVPLLSLEAVAVLAPEARHKTNDQTKNNGKPATGNGKTEPPAGLLGAARMAERMSELRDDERPAAAASLVLSLAKDWMEKQPPATSGEGGHNTTFAVACGLVRDFGLLAEEAGPLLAEYNERCIPEWSAEELAHKLAGAVGKAEEEPERVGWRLLEREKRVNSNQGGKGKGKGREADRLVSFVRERAELWRSPLGEAFATVTVGNHKETHQLGGNGFADWLVDAWLEQEDKTPGKTAREEAIDSLACLARARGDEYEPPVRVTATEEGRTVWLDLCDKSWRAVRVTANGGWELVANPPVRFVRFAGALALPEPQQGGTLAELRPFIAVSDEDWPLVLAWLVGCFLPVGTYACLLASGSQGSGKSTMMEALRRLVDPQATKPPVGLPREQEALLLAARSAFVAAYNNVSRIDDGQSDWACCLVEGTATTKRTLYTTAGQTILSAKRPVLLNGIGSSAVRGDLLDRSLLVSVSPPEKRRDEAELWREYEAARPRILGALLSAVATALARVSTVTVPEPKPRLLDFAKFATAAEPALGLADGSVLAAMRASKAEASETATAVVVWLPALRKLLEREKGEWTGTATELLEALATEETRPRNGSIYPNRKGGPGDWPGWPKGAQPLSNSLARLAPDLEATGIGYERLPKGHGGVRPLRLWLVGGAGHAGQPEAATPVGEKSQPGQEGQ
jgi:hypothetical protein